ncbi:MAG: phosphatidate cytidylyltransferase [Chloroflexi bacterium]|nr:phosphatidate cytidylyltransferase [Chloroflexota bacterium]
MAEAAQKPSPPSNLTQRIITAAIAIPPVILLISLGDWPFGVLLAVVGLLAVLEMYYMMRHHGHGVVFLLSVFYVGAPLTMLMWLRSSTQGLVWCAIIVSITWVTDSMAYVGGRLFGRTPLSLRISPSKTREGALIGYASGGVATILTLAVTNYLTPASLILALIGPIAAIVGDLFESYIKRRFHKKDSHLPGLNILPGHGGVMDRIDGLLFVCVLCFGFAVLVGLN